jgi:DNA-binding MarR family transcriptional regulator
MPKTRVPHDEISMPVLLRHARTTYGSAMRDALAAAGYEDIPKNGLYVIGGLALHRGDHPLGELIADLRISKQAAGQLVDTLVTRGYLQRDVDAQDRRRLTVALTERGRDAATVQAAARVLVDDELLAKAGAKDVERTRRTLAILTGIGRNSKPA